MPLLLIPFIFPPQLPHPLVVLIFCQLPEDHLNVALLVVDDEGVVHGPFLGLEVVGVEMLSVAAHLIGADYLTAWGVLSALEFDD